MSDEGSAAERDVVRKLARGSLLSRLKRSRQPLKLVAVPRDHVARRPPARRCAARRPLHRRRRDAAARRPRFRRDRRGAARSPSSCRAFPGCATSPPPPSREKGARLGRGGGRPLAARPRHQGRRGLGAASVGRADPLLDRLRALHPVEPRQRLSLGPAQHARARRAPPRRQRRQGAGRARRGSPPGAAWSPPGCSSRAASRASRAARPGSPGRSPSAQFDDGGLISRSPVRTGAAGRPARPAARLLFRRQADHPRRHRGRRRGRARRASWRHAGRRRVVELAGLRARRSGAARRADRRLRHARPAAAPGARLGLSADVARSARSWSLDAAPPPPQKMAAQGCRLDPGVRTVATARSGWWSIAAARARCRPICPTSWSRACARPPPTARWSSPTPIRPTSCADGSLGKGVEDVTIERSEDNDASRLEASHDGYVRALRPGPQAQPDARQRRQGIARRRPADRQGPQEDPRSRALTPSASISRRASRRPSPPTAWARSSARAGAPPWNFRCRGGNADDRGKPVDRRPRPSRSGRIQLSIVGEVSALGGEIGWQFRRTS